jgi:hypothetical protein
MAQKNRIFRLTHYKNLPFILTNGIHCANSKIKDPNFIPIGAKRLIESRATTPVKSIPDRVLNDYVPFYFCAKSPMLYVLSKRGVEGIECAQEDLVYLVSSVELIADHPLDFVFTDRHAVLAYANFFNQIRDLHELNWDAIRSDHWGDRYDPTRTARELKQAEFLVYQHVPIDCIEGIICQTEKTATFVAADLAAANCEIPHVTRPEYFF